MNTSNAKGMFKIMCTQLNVKNVVIELGILADNIPLSIEYNSEKNKFITLLEGEKSKHQLNQKTAAGILQSAIFGEE